MPVKFIFKEDAGLKEDPKALNRQFVEEGCVCSSLNYTFGSDWKGPKSLTALSKRDAAAVSKVLKRNGIKFSSREVSSRWE